MCKKCSFDVGSGFRNNCKCKCKDLDWADDWGKKGHVMGCLDCRHLIDGFYKWICLKCGYLLPPKSDLLKICPQCKATGEFKRIKEAFS